MIIVHKVVVSRYLQLLVFFSRCNSYYCEMYTSGCGETFNDDNPYLTSEKNLQIQNNAKIIIIFRKKAYKRQEPAGPQVYKPEDDQ